MARAHRFLFLQGPHGPFFSQLARALTDAGHECWRVGVNGGDQTFWHDKTRFLALRGAPDTWVKHLQRVVAANDITDIVLYGDARPLHAAALKLASWRGLTPHVLEEGYLRPSWITYERGPSNGAAAVCSMTFEEMARFIEDQPPRDEDIPARWGDLKQHVCWSAAYHLALLARRRNWPAYRSHRAIPVSQEVAISLRRVLSLPLTAPARKVRYARVVNGGYPFHLVLLQLSHDASRLAHARFAEQPRLVEHVVGAFADHADPRHHLVFRAHPLDDGRDRVAETVAQAARSKAVSSRVHYLSGGPLAPLLDAADSAITDTSTAGVQALLRGLPLLAFGRTPYARAGLTAQQSTKAFFEAPEPPDPATWHILRRYLLATSQVGGGFYSRKGRARLLKLLPTLMLAPAAPAEQQQDETVTLQLRGIR